METASRPQRITAMQVALFVVDALIVVLACITLSITVFKQQEAAMHFPLKSPAFASGQPIPTRFTEDGKDVSPALSWSGVPDGTREFALVCDDPDAPTSQPWVHWVMYGIPGETRELPEGIPTDKEIESPVHAMQGKNSWSSGQTIGYRGPAPPKGHGTHHYHFKLYALDAELSLKPGVEKSGLLKAMSGHVLGEAELVGTYER